MPMNQTPSPAGLAYSWSDVYRRSAGMFDMEGGRGARRGTRGAKRSAGGSGFSRRGGALLDLLPCVDGAPLEIGEGPVVRDDDVRAGALLRGRRLRRDHGARLG